MIEPTQEDRDLLDVIWKHSLNWGSRENMEEIIARHRIAAVEADRRGRTFSPTEIDQARIEGAKAGLAAAIEALARPAPDSVALVKAGLEAAAKVAERMPVYGNRAIEAAIRNLDPAAIAAIGVDGEVG